MMKLLTILTARMAIMTKLLFRYWRGPGAASEGQPVYRAYVVVILPRLPRPETRAEAAATPTSPCRRWNISFVHVIHIGTVGPSPNPISNRPP